MIFLSYPHSKYSSLESYGWSEYSYRYLAEAFMKYLEDAGHAFEIVHTKAELEKKAFFYKKTYGEKPVHLSFAPPQASIHAPSARLFLFTAWEFPNIPATALGGNPRQDWLKFFEVCEGVIFMTSANLSSPEIDTGANSKYHVLPPNIIKYFEAISFNLSYRQNLPAYLDLELKKISEVDQSEGILKQGQARALYVKYLKMQLPNFAHKALVKLYHLYRLQNDKRNRRSNNENHMEEMLLSEISSKIIFSTWANIHDPRKNLRFIIEVVNEYSQWFQKECSLIVKVHGSDQDCKQILQLAQEINQFYPDACVQVLATNEYLTQEKHLLLRKKASIYLNASSGEGLCLPVLEHLLVNCPAVVPRNSAFLDYPNSQFLKKVEVDAVPTYFPQDPSRELRTHAQPPIRKAYIKAITELINELEENVGLIDVEVLLREWLDSTPAKDFLDFLIQK